MTESLEISVEQVKRRLDGGEDLQLLDVRHPFEWQAARIDGAVLIPLDELPQRLAELDSGRPIVVYCHLGVRSRSAARYLRQQNFADAVSMAGGIEAWSKQIDPSVQRYDYTTLKRQAGQDPQSR